MFTIEMDNIDDIIERFEYLLNPEALAIRTVKIAQDCGVILLQASVQACIDAVYGALNETTDFEHEYERTLALLDSHTVEDLGMDQVVLIDPEAEAVDQHSGKEFVTDYAIPVHEGYTQWVFGRNTGVFHPGKFWFDIVVQESGPVLAQYIATAFEEVITIILKEVFL